MKRFLFPLLAATALASSPSKATDFHLKCEWVVDGEVTSLVEVMNYQMLIDDSIEVLLPETVENPAMQAYFHFSDETAYVDLRRVDSESSARPEEKKRSGHTLFDGPVRFKMGQAATVLTAKAGETSKSFIFTVTPPKNWVPNGNGRTQLTDAEMAELDCTFNISGSDAYLTIHNGNPFDVSHALVRIKSKISDAESKVDRIYSVHLNVGAFSDEFQGINDSMPLPEQEYEITLESAYR